MTAMRKAISLEDEIDGPVASSGPAHPRGLDIRARHVVHLQLLATILSVLYGLCERWGYSNVLETGLPGMFSQHIVGTVAASALAFPVVIFLILRDERPREKWAWAAAPLSLVMGFVQIFAILPSVS